MYKEFYEETAEKNHKKATKTKRKIDKLSNRNDDPLSAAESAELKKQEAKLKTIPQDASHYNYAKHVKSQLTRIKP